MGLREPRLRERPENPLRRAGRGEVPHHLGVMLFHVGHPARAAACHHRESPARTEAAEELVPLLHDRDIRAPVHVADKISPKHLDRGDQLPLGVLSRLKPEFITDRHTGGRREGDDRFDIRIVKPVDRGVALILFAKRPRGADKRALAALNAARGIDPAVRADDPDAALRPDVIERQSADSLHLAADLYAAPAADALIHVAQQTVRARIHRALRDEAAVAAVILQPHVKRHVLQFAVAVTDAGRAVLIVV